MTLIETFYKVTLFIMSGLLIIGSATTSDAFVAFICAFCGCLGLLAATLLIHLDQITKR